MNLYILVCKAVDLHKTKLFSYSTQLSMILKMLINITMKIDGIFRFIIPRQSFILLINVKMPTIVGILTFMSRIFMLSRVEHEKKFYNLGADHLY